MDKFDLLKIRESVGCELVGPDEKVYNLVVPMCRGGGDIAVSGMRVPATNDCRRVRRDHRPWGRKSSVLRAWQKGGLRCRACAGGAGLRQRWRLYYCGGVCVSEPVG